MSREKGDIPRWAQPLGAETWQRINELLSEGYGASDIAQIAGVPPDKLRSLQVHARRYGPKRRLIRYAEFKDALLRQAGEFGEDLVKALSRIAALAISPETKPEIQMRAFCAMNEFATAIGKMMSGEDKLEHERLKTQAEKDASKRSEGLSRDAIANILSIYGLDPDDLGAKRVS